MRWSYLIPRVALLLAALGYVRWGMDPSVRWAGRLGLSSVSGRAVEVDDVRTTVWPPSAEATGLDVADAAAERAEVRVGRMRVSMDADALKHRRAVADEIVLEDVRWDVPAEFEIAPDATATGEAGWTDALTGKAADAFAEQAALVEGRLKERLDPDSLETVRLAKSKEDAYRTTIDALIAEYTRLREKTESLRTLARDPDVRRRLLLEPGRIEQAAADAAATKARLKQLKDELASLRTRLPADLAELDAAKDRDLASLRAEYEQMKAAPLDAASLVVGETAAGAMRQVAVWWPRWKKFRESSEWDEVHHVEGRGRTVHFLPPHAGPDAGVNRMLMSGVANRGGAEWPFRCEVADLHYPAAEPATFRWASGGETPVEAVGFVGLDDSGPRLKLQFRVTGSRPVDTRTDLGPAAMAFRSGPPVVEGTLEAGAAFDGSCRVRLPGAKARFHSEKPLVASLLSAMDVDAAELVPVVRFDYDGGRPDCELSCPQLADVGEAWKSGLADAGRRQFARLEAEAGRLVTDRLQSLGGFEQELAALTQAVPGLQVAGIPGVTDGRLDAASIGRAIGEGRLRESLIERAGFRRDAEKPAKPSDLLKSVFR